MTQTAEPTADQLRTDALRGPWQAVLSDRYGFVYTDADDARENAEDEDEELTVSVVRGTAAPADRGGCRMRLPGSNQCGDEAYAIEAFLDDDDPSVGAEVRLIQAQAMAAGLNAASDTLSAAPAGAQATPTPVNVTGEAVAHCPDCDIAVPIGEITDEGRHAECGAFVQPA